jgi:hypothetical protein
MNIVSHILGEATSSNGKHHVSLYERERVYGGPEEGGWWYTVYTYIASRAFEYLRAAEDFAGQAWDRVEQTNEFRGSCYTIVMEDTPGSEDNSRDPAPVWE